MAINNDSLEYRFWNKVNVKSNNECWEWSAYISPQGYGKISVNNRPQSAHVLSYKMANDDHNQSLVVDHICRNRKCVNPKHLRQVTQRINAIENSESNAAKNAQKTHCPYGHLYDTENTVLKNGVRGKYRRCRRCIQMYRFENKEKRRLYLKEWRRKHPSAVNYRDSRGRKLDDIKALTICTCIGLFPPKKLTVSLGVNLGTVYSIKNNTGYREFFFLLEEIKRARAALANEAVKRVLK